MHIRLSLTFKFSTSVSKSKLSFRVKRHLFHLIGSRSSANHLGVEWCGELHMSRIGRSGLFGFKYFWKVVESRDVTPGWFQILKLGFCNKILLLQLFETIHKLLFYQAGFIFISFFWSKPTTVRQHWWHSIEIVLFVHENYSWPFVGTQDQNVLSSMASLCLCIHFSVALLQRI